MSTISENLQTIKSSTDAIKQAIIDKGGTISGDITTWASAISGISGGGSEGSTGEIINNVYISVIESYLVAPPSTDSVDVFCSFEYPVDFNGNIVMSYYNGDTTVIVSEVINEGDSEHTFSNISLYQNRISLCLLPLFNSETSYVFKYNYI